MKSKTRQLSACHSEFSIALADGLPHKYPDGKHVNRQGAEAVNSRNKPSDTLAKTKEVAFCRSHLPVSLANQLLALPRGLRGRTVGFILLSHSNGLDVKKLVEAAAELRRLGVLLNQSLRVSRGTSVDLETLNNAVQKVKEMWP